MRIGAAKQLKHRPFEMLHLGYTYTGRENFGRAAGARGA
jgi:hypothetical protein